MANDKKYKPRKSGVDVFVNVIITLVILGVLGLSVYAVGGKLQDNLKEKKQEAAQSSQSQQGQQDTYTVQAAADEKGLSVEDFIKEYGLKKNTDADDLMSTMTDDMTVENYAKLNDKSFEDFISENQLPDTVKNTTKWKKAQDLVPISVTVGGEDQFNQLKEQLELDDTITKDTPSGEALPVIQEKYAAYMQKAQQQSAQTQAATTEAAQDTTNSTENK